ncbi:MAG TPA: hypothetical protein VJK07_04075 [Candidatus Nanoarchaeia archaeon]|nr:hypothetical protein [Candidatus Nanoarchaeia archaeon]
MRVIDRIIRFDRLIGLLGESEGIDLSKKEFLDVPVLHQLSLLGIDSRIVATLIGRKTLDVGCGSGLLVNELRLLGIEAYGIDIRAPDKTYFMRQNVTPDKGIPAPGEHYHLITSFQNVALNDGLGPLQNPTEIPFFSYEGVSPRQLRKYQEEKAREAKSIVSEIGRVLSSEGRAIIYPPLPNVEKYASHTLRESGLEVRHEPILNPEAVNNYFIWDGVGLILEDRINTAKRTILTKK